MMKTLLALAFGVVVQGCVTRVKRSYYCGNWYRDGGTDANKHATPLACATRCQNEFGSTVFAAYFKSEGYPYDICECVEGGKTCDEKASPFSVGASSVWSIDGDCDGGGDGAGSGDEPADKVCIDVRKKKACKALSYCNFDRKSSPMCTDVTPGAKIPIKEFCEIIPTRGWCKRVDGCFWTGNKCMLKSEATCDEISRRRICQPLRSKNGGCLNGNHCFWTGQYCIETRGTSC